MKYRENNWKLDTNLYNSVVKCSAYKYTDETTSIVHNLANLVNLQARMAHQP